MTPWEKFVVGLIGVLLGVSFWLHLHFHDDVPRQEDSPGWDCRKDGNKVCGPTTAEFTPYGIIVRDRFGKGVTVVYRGNYVNSPR